MAKRCCIYGVLAAICMVFGYIETLLPLNFIAPGIKLGLANSVALLLLIFGDIKGAFAVNITRILLSAFLFSSPFSLLFSLTAGVISLLVSAMVCRKKIFSTVAVSVFGAVVHNLAQTAVALALFGTAILYYFPFLILSGIIGGLLIGVLCNIISKKIKISFK